MYVFGSIYTILRTVDKAKFTK